ncbi:hypothetical protein SD70_12900 [Gordoniibacillus kamchatkensis]|uniref:YtkA-like domain-containing protein n=1 Tax=Gordoniibacillus kamchatkensis TaxID=1590651 RepID=A0ABR5AHT2_9BACL|nr:hypothetical protein [Paenibacillus sp. VKM B-2647]KIL40477.1 hypothetical protein SD70_12900 [Paenibacillus sp. VKM B-2647]
MKRMSLLLLGCLLLTACGSANPAVSPAGSGQEHHHKPSLDVKLDISGRQVTVRVTTDMTISAKHYGEARKDGEGHIHMYLDNGEKIGVTQEEQVFKDLVPGPHVLKVSLHNNDHTPYDVNKTINFDIK